MKPNLFITPCHHAGRMLLAVIFTLSLTACFEEQKDAVSYVAINHTDQSVMSIIINGEGGILNAPAQGDGGEMCCVIVPHKWRPGLMVTVKWQNDDIPVLDANGKRVIKNGVPESIESPWKQRTVELPKYEGKDKNGQVHIHFLANDEIKVLRSAIGIGAPDYPIPYPTHQQAEAACKKYPNTPVCGELH